MTKAVTVKNITFQEGETLICVPLIGKTLAELQTNARALATAGADIIEWRVDHFSQAAVSGLTDVIDIELFNDEAQIRSLVSDAHAAGVKVIMSNHDFHKTPAQEDIIYRLRRMQDLGADLPKIAVMPQSPQDVLTLLSATLTMKEKYATRPLITMSMGKSGGVSRVTGRLFGSAMTFGTVGQASAPGQIAITQLRELMDILS